MTSVSVRNLVSGIGLLVAVTTTLVVPTGYFLTGYFNKAGITQYKADLGAVPISQYIYSHNVLWQYQELRLEELLEIIDRTGEPVRKLIIDFSGKTVLDEGPELAAPILTRSAPIVVSGATVGRIEIATSLRRLLVETALVSILGGFLGYAVYFALRILSAAGARSDTRQPRGCQSNDRGSQSAASSAERKTEGERDGIARSRIACSTPP